MRDGVLIDQGIVETSRFYDATSVESGTQQVDLGAIQFLPGTSSAMFQTSVGSAGSTASLQASADQLITVDFDDTRVYEGLVAGSVAVTDGGTDVLLIALGDDATSATLPRTTRYTMVASPFDTPSARCQTEVTCGRPILFVVRVT